MNGTPFHFVPYYKPTLTQKNLKTFLKLATESPSFSTLSQQLRKLLGIEDFPAEKQKRLSQLLELNNDASLTLEQKSELEQLLKEAEKQETLNLRRLAGRLPDRKRKNESCC